MKSKILFILFVTLFSNLSFSQKISNKPTRQQTETWLLEKTNKYIHKKDYNSFDVSRKEIGVSKKNITLEFTDKSIIVKYDVEEYISNKYMSEGVKIEKNNYSEKVTIPLKDISNKIFIKDNYLVFESNYNSFVTTRNDGFVSKSRWKSFSIDANEEENFANRFDRAMNHLLSFVKKSKPSETF